MKLENREDFKKALKEKDPKWIQKNIHPFVTKTKKDKEESYFNKMVLFAYAKDLKL